MQHSRPDDSAPAGRGLVVSRGTVTLANGPHLRNPHADAPFGAVVLLILSVRQAAPKGCLALAEERSDVAGL